MNVTTTQKGSIRILNLNGRFDSHEAPSVREVLDNTLKHSAHIVVNLADVNFMDSTALAVLVQGMKHCRMKEGDLRLAALQQPVRVIFELTRLDRAFSIFDDEKHAVASF